MFKQLFNASIERAQDGSYVHRAFVEQSFVAKGFVSCQIRFESVTKKMYIITITFNCFNVLSLYNFKNEVRMQLLTF